MGTRIQTKSRPTKRPMADMGTFKVPGRIPKLDKKGYPDTAGIAVPVLVRPEPPGGMSDDPPADPADDPCDNPPTMSDTKNEILYWLDGVGISGVESLSKAELIDLAMDYCDHP